MDEKKKYLLLCFIIIGLQIIIFASVFVWTGYQKRNNKPVTEQTGSIIQEIRQIDNLLEQYGKDIRTGFDNIQAGIRELKGSIESNSERINRIEKGTGKAIGSSESIIERLTGIESKMGELRESLEGQGNIGEEFRREIDFLRKAIEDR